MSPFPHFSLLINIALQSTNSNKNDGKIIKYEIGIDYLEYSQNGFLKSRGIKKKELVEIEITAVNCYEEIYWGDLLSLDIYWETPGNTRWDLNTYNNNKNKTLKYEANKYAHNHWLKCLYSVSPTMIGDNRSKFGGTMTWMTYKAQIVCACIYARHFEAE